MRVYRKRPSGLSPADLSRATRTSPWRAATALAALGGAFICLSLVGTDFGGAWAILSLVLVGSTGWFAMFSRSLALVRPSIVLSSVPKWDGQVRTAWLVVSDDPVATARSIAECLDAEVGPSLVATVASDGTPTGTTLASSLSQDELPVLIGWSTVAGRAASLDASAEGSGIWLRLDVGATCTASLLASQGEATDVLCRVIASV